MIYLTTGANGAGKTLNTLEFVRKKQIEEGRTVYYNGFDMKPEKATEFGWLPFDPKDWMALPDGAILVCDECQNQFPVRGSGAATPAYVSGLAEHRKRGFDFFMITQHPLNIDKFVLRLIGSPGWHRHLKRAFGTNMVSVLEWSAVATNCEKAGAGKSAKVSMVPFPKHVYDWYDSAVLHTGKKQIPFKVYLLGVLMLAIPALFYFGFQQVTKIGKPPAPATSPAAAAGGPAAAPAKPDYVASFIPRVEGLPYTAPRYDDITKPTTAPFPSACVQMGARCNCYSQQGTKLQTAAELCLQIVKNGFFMDWNPNGQSNAPASLAAPAAPPPQSHQPDTKLTGGNIPDTPPPAVLTRNDLPSPDADVVRFMHKKPI